MAQSPLKTENITYSAVRLIADRYQIKRSQIRNILGISESTQFRYEKSNPILKPHIIDRWTRCSKIIEQAQELFENRTEVQRWLSTPKQALESRTPLELFDTDSGCRQVEQMLLQANYGVFA